MHISERVKGLSNRSPTCKMIVQNAKTQINTFHSLYTKHEIYLNSRILPAVYVITKRAFLVFIHEERAATVLCRYIPRGLPNSVLYF